MIANLCTHNNCLPQGAPTSPILSNMVCASLDTSLQRLAKKYGCIYTRYADDITFSTSHYEFPVQLVFFDKKEKALSLGEELLKIIERQGFKVNESKTRLRTSSESQEVTGIIVNEKLNVKREYVRQVRAMLHAWEKYGLENAQADFQKKYYINPIFQKECPPFEYVVKGKVDFIGQVRGRQDKVYQRFLAKLRKLSPELVPEIHLVPGATLDENKLGQIKVEIWTEGKTDVMHLKAALCKLERYHLANKINLSFKEDRDPQKMGDIKLLDTFKALCETEHEKLMIAIFDRDNHRISKEHSSSEEFKEWGNNIYSFMIPIPPHRSKKDEICIELYYQDDEIKTEDENGRRLFLGGEFNPVSRRHKSLNLNTIDLNKTGAGKEMKIIEKDVFDSLNNNVALTKNDFAKNILNAKDRFDGFDFSAFKLIFDVIRKIVIHNLDEKSPQK